MKLLARLKVWRQLHRKRKHLQRLRDRNVVLPMPDGACLRSPDWKVNTQVKQ